MVEAYRQLDSGVVASSETAVSPHQTTNCHRNLQARNSNTYITFSGIFALARVKTYVNETMNQTSR